MKQRRRLGFLGGINRRVMCNRLSCLCFLVFASVLLASPVSAMMSIEEEREMRDKLLRMVESRVPLIKDPEIVGYVSSVGQKVLDQVDVKFFDYEFFVIQDDGLNAFAMPGGLVFVHTGLLELIDTENELLCVLAHETGHVQGRHIARRMERMQRINIATAAIAIAGLFLGQGQVGSAIFATSSALNASIALKYSRVDEEEADRRACQWICKAGHDPRGLLTALKKMQKYRWLGTSAIPSYLSTHPGASERTTYLEDLWDRERCVQKFPEDPFRLRKIQVKTRVLTHDPMVMIKYYKQELNTAPDDIFLLYGLAQSLLAARKYNEALKAFDNLVSSAPEKPEFKVDQGRAYFAAGKYKTAISIIGPYSKRHPGDSTARFFLARAYLEHGKPAEALPILKTLKQSWPDPASIYLQLGRCFAALEKQGEAHDSFYRHYKAIGDQQSAQYHKNKALELFPPDSKPYNDLKSDKNQEKPKP
ncbi:MAG: M48 family metalloprotease [Deltaproteobacteria bacterium]|nr:M48 family metalloprotease [Deltaproteobacteria bacterium]MBW2080830.1 M48 family metalloprotease [Deltaproteobacteria bacterium]